MGGEPLDLIVRDFLDTFVATECDLYVLVTLIHSHERWLDAGVIASELGLSSHDVARSLDAFTAGNLLDIRISDELRYRLRPGTHELEASLHAFASTYRRRPAAILRWASQRERRNRTAFADAFRFRRG